MEVPVREGTDLNTFASADFEDDITQEEIDERNEIIDKDGLGF